MKQAARPLTVPAPKPMLVLEPQQPTNIRRLARLLAELAWKRAQVVQSTETERAA